MTDVCVDCGRHYAPEEGEIRFFIRKGLELPKRCHTCRATRRGIEGTYLICKRCGKQFLYPWEIQLYARTYKWDTPEVCFGGCGNEKFARGYEPTKQERESIEIFGIGRLIRYLLGQGKVNSSAKSGYCPKIYGFENSPSVNAQQLRNYLTKTFPEVVLKEISNISYTNNVIKRRSGKFIERGCSIFFPQDAKAKFSILINRQHPQKIDTISNIKWTICHEIGHIVYKKFLNEEDKAEWYSFFKDQYEFFTFEGKRSEEDYFAECFAGYYEWRAEYTRRLSSSKRKFIENSLKKLREQS